MGERSGVTNFVAAYSLQGRDIDPDEITRSTRIGPTAIRRIGDPMPYLRRVKTTNDWVVATGEIEGSSGEALTRLFELLRPGWDRLAKIGLARSNLRDYEGPLEIDSGAGVGLSLSFENSPPDISIASDAIVCLAELHASLDIDVTSATEYPEVDPTTGAVVEYSAGWPSTPATAGVDLTSEQEASAAVARGTWRMMSELVVTATDLGASLGTFVEVVRAARRSLEADSAYLARPHFEHRMPWEGWSGSMTIPRSCVLALAELGSDLTIRPTPSGGL
jgi:hypothetical protein